MRTLGILLLTLCIAAAAAAQAGQRPASQNQTQDENRPTDRQTILVDVPLVNILFTVVDRKGKFITNLKREDFTVYEDSRRQIVTNFSSETDLPLTIALLVDTSGSIRDKLRFEQEAAIEFFYATLKKGKDKALLITFDSGVDLLQDYTDNPEILSEAIRKIRAGGGTSLYDAVYLGVTEKLTGHQGRRVLIVISDGDDNSSRISMTETLEAAQRNEVTIYAISTNSTAYFGSREQERGDKTLKKFADETGGKAFFPFKLQDLAVSFQDISEELRSQYTIAYRPSNDKPDGTFRRLRIDVANRQYQVRARNGYYAPKAQAASQRIN